MYAVTIVHEVDGPIDKLTDFHLQQSAETTACKESKANGHRCEAIITDDTGNVIAVYKRGRKIQKDHLHW